MQSLQNFMVVVWLSCGITIVSSHGRLLYFWAKLISQGWCAAPGGWELTQSKCWESSNVPIARSFGSWSCGRLMQQYLIIPSQIPNTGERQFQCIVSFSKRLILMLLEKTSCLFNDNLLSTYECLDPY